MPLAAPRCVVLLLLLAAGMCCARSKLNTVYEWRDYEFLFDSDHHRQQLTDQGDFYPNASVPFDVDVHGRRVFITTPRIGPGVPATLSTVTNKQSPGGPVLAPYPNWSWHQSDNCEGMTSVFRVTIDPCGRLWVLDTGSIDIFGDIKQICPRQILVFGLANNKLIRRHRFPDHVVETGSLLTTIQVEVVDSDKMCISTYAYVTDTDRNALVVYDMKRDRSWRVTDDTFSAIPPYDEFSLQGSNFNLSDGILGLAVSSAVHNKPRTLYYHSLASNTENHVVTSVLHNEANFANGGNTVRSQFETFPRTRKGQSAAQDITSDGVLFYSELVDTSLRCYNTRLEYKGGDNPVVARDPERLQFAAGMKVRKNRRGKEEIWILTNRAQKLLAGTLTDSEVNFRVLGAKVRGLIAGTECQERVSPMCSLLPCWE